MVDEDNAGADHGQHNHRNEKHLIAMAAGVAMRAMVPGRHRR